MLTKLSQHRMNVNRTDSVFVTSGRAFPSPGDGNVLERFLRLFAEVRGGEGWTAMLLMVNLFILLTAYLIIKTVREPLILASGGAEVKSYAAAGQALLLLLVVPAYGFLASKVNRIKLITWVNLFFISNLVAFYILAQAQVPLGVVFFLWVGIFNLLVIAQFWSFANDVYTEEQGKRLFALIAFGGSAGAILGPTVAGWLFKPLGPYPLMLVTAALLTLYLVIINLVNGRKKHLSRAPALKQQEAEKPLGKEGAFKLVVRQALSSFDCPASSPTQPGEYYGRVYPGKNRHPKSAGINRGARISGARHRLAPTVAQAESQKVAHAFIGEFYASFFFWVSLISAMVQLFLVSRIIRYLGVSVALFVLPVIALGSYSLMIFMPVLSYIMGAKVIENSVDYSLQNTCRQALFLPTSREAKYKAKAAIDTFFVRTGDVLSSVLVFIAVQLAFDTGAIAKVNRIRHPGAASCRGYWAALSKAHGGE